MFPQVNLLDHCEDHHESHTAISSMIQYLAIEHKICVCKIVRLKRQVRDSGNEITFTAMISLLSVALCPHLNQS